MSGPDPSAEVHQRVGFALIGAAGVISVLTTSSLLVYLAVCTRRAGSQHALSKGVRSFLQSPMGWYFLSLAISDFLQAFAFATNFYWVPSASISPGRFCSMQGVVSQIGDLGSVIWSVVIAYHTFFLLFLQRKPVYWLPGFTLASGWALIIALPIVGSIGKPDFWGDSGAWCWIAVKYRLERVFFLHFFIWIGLFSSVVVYGLIYLKFAGIIEYPRQGPLGIGGRMHRPLPRSRPTSYATDADSDMVTNHVAQIARRLAWYPFLFTFVSVPITVCRIRALMGLEIPFWLFVFAGVLYTSSGTTNAVLFMTTRHALIQHTYASAGIQITTHQISVIDPQVDGYRPHKRRAHNTKVLFPENQAASRDPAPFALKLGAADDRELPVDSLGIVHYEAETPEGKTGTHHYPPQVTWQ